MPPAISSFIANHEIIKVNISTGSTHPKSAMKFAIHLELTLSFIFPAITISANPIINDEKLTNGQEDKGKRYNPSRIRDSLITCPIESIPIFTGKLSGNAGSAFCVSHVVFWTN